MDLDEYQQQLIALNKFFTIEGDPFEFNCIGLAEEAGEVMGKLKRALRGEGFDRNGYLLELGDVLGYLVLAAGAKEIEMSEIFDLVTPCSPIMEDNWLHVIAASKRLYHKVDNLLQTVDTHDKKHITLIMSEILYAINWCANAGSSGLSELMTLNLNKLHDRLERNGNLLGSGDNR